MPTAYHLRGRERRHDHAFGQARGRVEHAIVGVRYLHWPLGTPHDRSQTQPDGPRFLLVHDSAEAAETAETAGG